MKKQLPLRMLLVVLFAMFALLACDVTQVALNPASPPTVSIGSPPHGAAFPMGQDVLVQANAADAIGITRVELWVDNVLMATAQPPTAQKQFPVILHWTPTTPGAHTLTVKAVNTNGDTSNPVAVSVNVLAPPEPTKPPTAIPTAPPTLPPTVALPTPSRTPECPPPAPLPAGILFSDDFGSLQITKCNGWGLTPGANEDYTWATNKYTISVKKQNWIGYSYPDREYDNFAAETEAQPISDGYAEYGLILRFSGEENAHSYYVYGANTDGKYFVYKHIAGAWSDVDPVPITSSPVIKQGKNKNTLGVVVQGNALSLYINRTLIRNVTDNAITGKGGVGVFVETGDNADAAVVFSRMTIYAPDRGKWD